MVGWMDAWWEDGLGLILLRTDGTLLKRFLDGFCVLYMNFFREDVKMGYTLRQK